MSKIGMPAKRAMALKLWALAQYGNNEEYYYSTLHTGFPDGEGRQTIINDLEDGFYDDDLNEIIQTYEAAKKAYAKDGYYLPGENHTRGTVVYTETEVFAYLESTGIVFPDKIYKC